MTTKYRKFLEMVSNIKTDHTVILGLLDDMDNATDKDAVKQLVVLKQLLVNHFFIEEFILYPYIRKRYKTKQAVNNASLFDRYEIDDGRDDMVLLTNTDEGYEHAGDKIIGMITRCADLKTDNFKACFQKISAILKKRIQFEDTILEKRIAPRIQCTVRVRLTALGKQILLGHTIDISETGCLIKSDEPVKDLSVGDRVTVHFPQDNTVEEASCTISRLTEEGLAVQFLVFCPESLMKKAEWLSPSRRHS